jgi:hypothetical protein
MGAARIGGIVLTNRVSSAARLNYCNTDSTALTLKYTDTDR